MLKGFYLSLYMGPVVTSPVPKEVINAVASVQVTQGSGQRSGFQIQFVVSKTSLIQASLLPSGYFDPLTRVQIVVTLAGQPNVVMDGLIARQELAPSNDPQHSTLTITGEDVSSSMSLIDFSSFPFPCLPPEARVAIIVAKYAMFGIVPVIIPGIFVDVPNPLETIPAQKGTDLDYINTLAGDYGYVFYVTPGPALGMNTAYFGPEIRYGAVQPALTVNSDASSNCDSLSFGYDGFGAKLYVAFGQIPQTTISIPVPIPDVGVLRPPLAARQPIPFKLEYLRKGVNRGLIQNIALGLAKASQSADAVTGQGNLNVLRYGRVLQSRQLVDVRGAGRTYDGTYYVKSVTHDIKRGEYKQNFSLAREGILPLTSSVTT